MTRMTLILTIAFLFPVQAAATSLQCIGTAPGFMAELTGDQARFDYLGDGTFPFTPALDPGAVYARHTIQTFGGPIPVFLERRACPLFSTDFPVRVEIVVPTGNGPLPMSGCCVERAE